MKKIIIKIIIWLFEKYAFDYWVEIQEKNEKIDIMRKNNLKSEEDFLDYIRDRQQEPLKEAYDAGKADGYKEAMEARGGNIY